jgi:hypothetical protein
MLEFSFSCGGESGAVLGFNLPSIVGSHQRMGATNNSKGFFCLGCLDQCWAGTGLKPWYLDIGPGIKELNNWYDLRQYQPCTSTCLIGT